MIDGIRRSVDKRTCMAFVPESPEPVFCTENERCRGCPYPAHGVICWHRDGTCLRTDMEKIERRQKNDSSSFKQPSSPGIDCLKRFNGQYVLFIPTWKQNGGWQQPAIRSIHLEDKGIAGHLIGLIKEQQETARQLQEFLPEDKKGMLFSYRQSYCRKGKPAYSTKLCFVASIPTVSNHFQKICHRYNILDETGNVYVVTTHQFRHNGITDRLAAGFTAAQIAEMTGHHGDAMIFNSYAHLNLMPETIREKQNYVLAERQESDKRYVLFGGRILNMDEQMEQRLMKNLRAHRVRGGICSDITNCKSDMWNCLECKAFVADMEQAEYYREQIALWREKQVRFSAFPIICENAKRNAGLFESILKSIETDVQRNEANNT